MKKLFLSFVAAIWAATATYAQSSLVATLSHKGVLSVFHGASSLKQAMEAADHGDIITLAGGRYDAVDITKAVTLRGAGMEEDAVSGAIRTQIIGGFSINIADSIPEHLTIEGICHEDKIYLFGQLNNAMFQKCRFNNLSCADYANTSVSLTGIHCIISGSISLSRHRSSTFISSVISAPGNGSGNMEFTNCIILGNISSVNNSVFTNCLFCVMPVGWVSGLNNTNMVSYCAATSENVFRYNKLGNKIIEADNNSYGANFNALFKPDTYYELTDEAKTEYVGQDGKEMGIYGGNLPFETRILSPQITKCNVAAKTTADGKLSVDIEVKAAE